MNFKYAFMNTGLTLLMALPALGASQEMVTVMPKKAVVVRQSSEHMRMDKNYLMTAQILGETVAPISSLGIAVGKYFGRNSILQFEATTGKSKRENFDLGATTLGANYKHFFGNSFYTKLGADYRQIELSNVNFFSYQDPGSIGTANSLTANVAIGNQWQWESFTLGCDWIGVNPTLLVLDNSRYNSPSLNSADKADLDRSWNDLAKVTSIQFTRLYLGASF